MADLAPGHGGNAGLCWEDHTCPSCEAGRPLTECVDLFEHPACGLVACCADEDGLNAVPERQPIERLVMHQRTVTRTTVFERKDNEWVEVELTIQSVEVTDEPTPGAP